MQQSSAAQPRSEGPIRRQRLYEQVLDRLLDMMRDGRLPPGSELQSERELMEELNVGRPAVREAMTTLASMGLVELSQGERARVTTPTADHLMAQISRTAWHMLVTSADGPRHLREARGALELAIILTAIEHATEAEIARIEVALKANGAALAAGDAQRFVDTDIDFHVAIAEASHNPIYVAMTRAVLGWLMDYRARIVATGIDQQAAYREHVSLFERIEARDRAGAVTALRRHLQRIAGPDDRHVMDGIVAPAAHQPPQADSA